jgi:phospholipid/cholesterol/gamma-HCH transport system substrate-binding protein
MKNDRINYLAVGAFVLVMFGLLLAVLYRLTGTRGDTDIYYAYFDNLSGLNRSAPVSFEGYPMGHILAIEPTQANGKTGYRLTLSVQEDWKIPRDSVARITAFSLLSEFVVDIHQGVSKDDLRPGDTLQGQQGGDFYSALNGVASDVSDMTRTGAKPLLGRINHLVDTVGGTLENRVPALLKDLKTLLAKLDHNADALDAMLNKDNQQHVSRLLKNADAASVNLLQLSSDVNKTRAQLDQLLNNSNALIKDSTPQLRASVTQLRNALDLVADNIDAIMHNTEGTSRNMYELSRQLRQNPGLLLGTKPPSDADKNTAPPKP